MTGLSFGKGFSFGDGLQAFGGTTGMSFGSGLALSPGAASVTGSILLEDGVNFIELEDGSGTILLDG